MTLRNGLRPLLCALLIAGALAYAINADLAQLRWVEQLANEGSPPPDRDPNEPTGFVNGQRHFLGMHERGETYRWIAYTQQTLSEGLFAEESYQSDTVPEGRPQLMPKLYVAWLTGIAAVLQIFTGDPPGICAEAAALWEPIITRTLAILGLVVIVWIRVGSIAATAAAIFVIIHEPLSAQFVPGALSPRPWALILAAYSIFASLRFDWGKGPSNGIGLRAACAAGAALWLDPAIGFTGILIAAGAEATALWMNKDLPTRALRWAAAGSVIVVLGWLIDDGPWDTAAGELRYAHPLYAMAWLGLGLCLHGYRTITASSPRLRLGWTQCGLGAALLAALGYAQIDRRYWGWLYPESSLMRFGAADDPLTFRSFAEWLAQAPAVEAVFALALPFAAIAAAATTYVRSRQQRAPIDTTLASGALALAALLLVAYFRIRWLPVASLIALPLLLRWAGGSGRAARQAMAGVGAAFLFGMFAYARMNTDNAEQGLAEKALRDADLRALIHRQFAHWLATHTPDHAFAALTSPELSDALIFHGGGQALLSSAWESYPGHIAASRVLSAPEATEAEAVLRSRGITHIILPSWDKVLPLLVRISPDDERGALYDRLQRWLLPLYLKPVPYQLPPIPGYLDQKLAVFQVTEPQDAALALSRLAEYFAEMKRPEPAQLAAKSLAETFPNDANAAIARVLAHSESGNAGAAREPLAMLAAETAKGRVPLDWDRRAARAIALAIGGRHDLAKPEIEACIQSMDLTSLAQLTPLRVFQLRRLISRYGLAFPSDELANSALSLSSEYGDK